MENIFLQPTQQSAAALMRRNIPGEVVMLNMIRLRKIADYSSSPDLEPRNSISGKKAFQLYIEHTLPYLKRSGGELVLLGSGGQYFIGPSDEQWDVVMLVKQNSVENFIAFASNPEYLAGIGHRTAAISDSRLLPIVEYKDHKLLK
jgi:uncharacterized protein (DUF1330 family)